MCVWLLDSHCECCVPVLGGSWTLCLPLLQSLRQNEEGQLASEAAKGDLPWLVLFLLSFFLLSLPLLLSILLFFFKQSHVTQDSLILNQSCLFQPPGLGLQAGVTTLVCLLYFNVFIAVGRESL